MFALRRASNSLKNHGVSARISIACYKSEIPRFIAEDTYGVCEPIPVIPNRLLSLERFHYKAEFTSTFYIGRRSLSSQAGSKSSGEEDHSEDEFSELETPPLSDNANEDDSENDECKISEPGLSDDDRDVEEAENEFEIDSSVKDLPKKWVPSELVNVIKGCKAVFIYDTLDKYVEEGNEMGRPEIELAMLYLRKRRMFGRALQLSEWSEKNNKLDFIEGDYASHLDLIAKVHGIFKAEVYFKRIPESCRGEVVYRTFLANTVKSRFPKKAEETFKQMKNLGFPLTTFTCNQLLILYKKTETKKIVDVLLLMDKEKIKPNLLTYKLLIDLKGESNDIIGMEKIMETMKAEDIEPDFHIHEILARHYINAGHKEKAKVILKAMEGEDLKENRGSCRFLLTLYAALGSAIDVERIWKFCEAANPFSGECLSAIEAWGKLNKVEKAEAVCNNLPETWKNFSKHYTALLRIYASHKMLAKGEDLVKQMSDSGCKMGPSTWDALVKLYIGAGEVEKADSFLQMAIKKSQMKPMFTSYITIMDQYSKKGDVHNTENIFLRMRQQRDYVPKYRHFQVLIEAYANAKKPAYGIRERLKVDKILPNRALEELLGQIDPFKKTAASELLD